MAKSIKAHITPEIVKWARRDAKMTIAFVASKLKVTTKKIEAWENGTELPSLRQAKQLANLYKQMFARFFLDALQTPPDTKITFKDYRTLDNSFATMSTTLWLDIKESLRQRDIAIGMFSEMDIPLTTFNLNYSDHLDLLASQIRSFLAIDTPLNFKTSDDAFKYFRKKFEEKQILIFQISDMDLREVRGISIYYENFPIIIVNRKDSYNGRIFTMFHEFAHLLKRRNSISLTFGGDDKDEVECNEIAGRVLLPQNHIINNADILAILDAWDEKRILRFTKSYGISQETFYRRLLSLSLIDENFYMQKREEFLKEYEKEEIRKAKARNENKIILMPDVNYVSKIGYLIPQVIIAAYYSNKISLADALSYCNLQSKFLSKIEGVIFK